MIKRYQKYKGIIVIELHFSSYINQPSLITITQTISNLRNLIFSHRFFFPCFFFLSSISFISVSAIRIYNTFMHSSQLFLFWFQCLIFFLCFDFVWFRSKFTILIHWEEIEKHRLVSNCLKTVSITLSFSSFWCCFRLLFMVLDEEISE